MMQTSTLIAFTLLLVSCCALADETIRESPITPSDREHWAFAPVAHPQLPSVQNQAWPRGGIDRFILAALEKKNLSPSPEADRLTLLRRVTFDLVGLPPSPAEIAEFESDSSPEAYERLVDRLLASPRYGERWAQHWLDLARFADTDGFEHDKVREKAWQYRDWVIAALNSDMPYDEFVTQQIAADLLPQSAIRNPQFEIATAFCLAGPDMPDVNDQVERRHGLLNEITATVGSVLLGLQLGCAQCHNHKYDPISQGDFYRLRAIFEPAVPLLKRDVPYSTFATHGNLPPARFYIRGDGKRPGPEVSPAVPRIASVTEQNVASRLSFAKWLFDEQNPLTARVMVNRVWQHHFGRGIFETSSDAGLMGVSPTHPELLDWLAGEFRAQGWSIKQLHRAIVTSATYRQASRALPSDDGWNTRLAADPANERYSRFSRRRLEGEAIRDAMLASAGILSSEAAGPGVMPPLPQELVDTLLKGQWTASPREAEHHRRSIYMFARRNLRYPLFEAFDRPAANDSCPVRHRSTIAPQSLLLLNGEVSLTAARHWAGRVLQESSTMKARVETLYLQGFGRRPSTTEADALSKFIQEEHQRLAQEARPHEKLQLAIAGPTDVDPYESAALVSACLAMFNASEFIYLE